MSHLSWSDGRNDVPTVEHAGDRGACRAPICRAYYAGLRKGWDIKAEFDAGARCAK